MDKIEFHKVRDFGELINDTFKFIRLSFKKLSRSLLYIMGPIIIIPPILYAFSQIFFSDKISIFGELNNANDWEFFSGYVFSVSIIGLIQMVFYQLIIYKFIMLYNDIGLENITVGTVWKEVRKDFWLIFFNTIYLVLAFIFTNTLLITASTITIILIPMMLISLFPLNLYFATTFSLVPLIRLNEKIGFIKSLSRSIQLIYGSWWMTFGFYFIVTIIISIFIYALLIPVIALGFITDLHNLKLSNMEFLQPAMIAINSLVAIINVFLYTIYMVGSGFQYYNTSEKKDGRALLGKIESISAEIT